MFVFSLSALALLVCLLYAGLLLTVRQAINANSELSALRGKLLELGLGRWVEFPSGRTVFLIIVPKENL